MAERIDFCHCVWEIDEASCWAELCLQPTKFNHSLYLRKQGTLTIPTQKNILHEDPVLRITSVDPEFRNYYFDDDLNAA